MTRLRALLRDAWTLIRPYWVSEDRRAGRGPPAAGVALALFTVFINVLLSQWYNSFYNAIQDKDFPAFWNLLIRFSWLALLYIIAAVYQIYLNQMLQIRWRRWLTERYLGAWLADGAHYRMQRTPAAALRLFVAGALSLSIGGLRAFVPLVSFLGILWGLSGAATIPLGTTHITIPGYMVWAALLYAIAGTWLTNRIGRPLVRLNFNQQRYEADFRFNLVRFRENAEGVALYRGEADEMRNFRERFSWVVRNWWDIMRRQKRLRWVTAGYGE